MKEIIDKGIVAILPQYIKNKGNCTTIYTKESHKFVVERSIRTIIRNICKHYHLDLRASNKTYGEVLSIKKSPPIPFTKNDIFISVKTRVPIGKDDGAFGYIKLQEIDKTKESETSKNNSTIHLKNGYRIKTYYKLETLNRIIKNGEIIEKLLHSQNPIYINENTNPYPDYNNLATKSDIALVYMELMEIKDKVCK